MLLVDFIENLSRIQTVTGLNLEVVDWWTKQPIDKITLDGPNKRVILEAALLKNEPTKPMEDRTKDGWIPLSIQPKP